MGQLADTIIEGAEGLKVLLVYFFFWKSVYILSHARIMGEVRPGHLQTALQHL